MKTLSYNKRTVPRIGNFNKENLFTWRKWFLMKNLRTPINVYILQLYFETDGSIKIAIDQLEF